MSTDFIEEEGVYIENSSFYNPVQRCNRTATIKIINTYRKQKKKECIKILECMSASGLRGIRYCREIEGEKEVVMNDISVSACRDIVRNCKRNGVNADIDSKVENNGFSVEVCNEDCRVLMLQRKNRYDVIDIDPFGTCSPYIDSAVESIVSGGLLCVTTTDTKVLCDKPPEACFKYYSATTINCGYSHEVAIRVILSYISRTAARFGRKIVPLVSLSIDFFIRVFVIVEDTYKGAGSVTINNPIFFLCQCLNQQSISIFRASKDEYRHEKVKIPEKCNVCGRRASIYGPLWGGNLHDKEFLLSAIESIDKEMLQIKTEGKKESAFTSAQVERRVHGLFNMVLEEIDTYLYYPIPVLAANLFLSMPPLASVLSFLEYNGYSFSLSHCKPNSLKTEASVLIIYLAIVEYHRTYSPIEYNRFIARHENNKTTIEASIYRAVVEYREKAEIICKFEPTEKAKTVLQSRYLKFPDYKGLYWGPGMIKKKNNRNKQH